MQRRPDGPRTDGPISPTADTPSARAAGWSRNVRGCIGRNPVVAYFVLAYVLSWGWWIPISLGDHGLIQSPWHGKLPGLLGPMLAAVIVGSACGGRRELRGLVAGVARWRVRWPVLLMSVSPILVAAAMVIAEGVGGRRWPAPSGFITIIGWPDTGIVGFLGLAFIVNGIGEEVGWRGFALPRLQAARSPLMATLILAVLWAGWHTPLFFQKDGLPIKPALLPVFYLGLFCGAVILTWIYNHSGGSILMAVIFHVSNNLSTATVAIDGLTQAVVSAVVMTLGLGLVCLELWRRSHGGGSVIGPPAGSHDSLTARA